MARDAAADFVESEAVKRAVKVETALWPVFFAESVQPWRLRDAVERVLAAARGAAMGLWHWFAAARFFARPHRGDAFHARLLDGVGPGNGQSGCRRS